MMAEKGGIRFGVWAFLIGLILAIVVALISGSGEVVEVPPWSLIVLAVLGILVGLLNVTATEVQKFLIASIAFLLSFSSLGKVFEGISLGWVGVGTFFYLLSVFMAPAAAVVAVKALFSIAKD
jgi:hypothetical protein